MKGSIGLLAALIWMATSGIAVAQEDVPASTPSADIAKVAQKKADSDRMDRSYEIYENVEVMRRILNRTLTNLPGLSLGGAVRLSGVAFSPDGNLVATTTAPGGVRPWSSGQHEQIWNFTIDNDPNSRTDRCPVEGVYLKGYGVVFSVTMPVERIVAASDAKAARPTPSEWERAKSELRGEKVEAEEKKREPERVSLTDTILKVLAENGRHFSRLAGDERLTVVVTLRTPESPANVFGFLTKSQDTPYVGTTYSAPAGTYNVPVPGYGQPYSYTSPVTQQPAEGTTRPQEVVLSDPFAGLRNAAANYAHLGDMRLKQGRIKESVEAYEKAAAEYQKVVESIKADMGGEHWKQKVAAAGEAADALMKLSQGYLLQGEKDRAYQIFNRAAELSSWAVSGKHGDGKAKTGTGSSTLTLPGRLSISTPRALLEHLATGKITFEEFKKSAEIQYLAF
jgi:hypothetical protein